MTTPMTCLPSLHIRVALVSAPLSGAKENKRWPFGFSTSRPVYLETFYDHTREYDKQTQASNRGLAMLRCYTHARDHDTDADSGSGKQELSSFGSLNPNNHLK